VGDDLRPDFIIPSVFDERVVPRVAEAARAAAVEDKVVRR
jgi:malate dehydrogenase (oxaloacetate-decarboxylating)